MAKRKGKARTPARPTEDPTCNCALLCDDVLISQGRGKHSLEGVIGAIAVTELPAVIGGFVTYVRLSNIYRDQVVSVSLDHADTGESVFEFEATLPSKTDPLGICTLIVPTPTFEIRSAGRYIFAVKSRGVPLAQSPINILTP